VGRQTETICELKRPQVGTSIALQELNTNSILKSMGLYMGKVLIASYVVITLLLAGFAKADQLGTDAQLIDVTFEKSNLEFLVSGQNLDGCSEQVMIADQKGAQNEVVEFRVLTITKLDRMCIQQVSSFVKRIPTRELIFLSKIEIDPAQVYTLTVANSTTSVQVTGAEILGLN
jgi:hypothetical protein